MDRNYTDEFLAFWKIYPRRVAKICAWKKWKEALRDPTITPEAIIIAAKQFAKSKQGKGDSRYIPHPATWLNQGRYEDEYDAYDELSNIEKAAVNAIEQEGRDNVRDPVDAMLSEFIGARPEDC